jgi:hypothetical protein
MYDFFIILLLNNKHILMKYSPFDTYKYTKQVKYQLIGFFALFKQRCKVLFEIMRNELYV